MVNTGDDVEISGNLVCPDLDSVLYTCADIIDTNHWFGIEGDTHQTHEQIHKLSRQSSEGSYLPKKKQRTGRALSRDRRFSGYHEFMRIGDRDRATHITRTSLLDEGADLDRATELMSDVMGIATNVLPMSNDPVSTLIETDEGPMHFQEFWIKKNGEPQVKTIEFRGAESASAPGSVFNALENPVVIGPSNPVTSIGPILSLPGVRDALENTTVIMISPFVNDTVFSGPAGDFLEAMGYEPSTDGALDYYGSILDQVILDPEDNTNPDSDVYYTNTQMDTPEDRKRLAREICRRVFD